MTKAPFTARYKLRFGQCDPAGIAFFPRLVEMVNWVVEDWFDEGLNASFRKVHMDQKLGMPAVALSVDFIGPAELGDEVEFALSVAGIGRSSVRLDIRASKTGGVPVLKASHTIAYCDFSGDRPKAIALDPELRRSIAAYEVVPESA